MIEPSNVPTPILSKKQRVALAVSQILIGLFIIFMAGTIMHYYFPISGGYGVHLEGVIIGVFVVLHVKRVIKMYQGTETE